MDQDELLKRIEQLEKQRRKSLQGFVLLGSGLVALAPIVLVILFLFSFDINTTIKEDERITQIQTREIPEALILQLSAALGSSLASGIALLSRSERFQKFIGLRAKD